MDNKFPILGSKPKEYIPLDIVKPHEKQAIINHSQTLERLAERGGLSWVELLFVLNDERYDYKIQISEKEAEIKVLEIIKLQKEINYKGELKSMDKVICILERGFSKISLPNGYVINITSCDDGCYIETKNMKQDIEELNKYVGLPIYEVCLDNNTIEKGFKLGECKLTTHCKYDYDYNCIFWNTESIIGDNMVEHVE